jgi:hypothetical protein
MEIIMSEHKPRIKSRRHTSAYRNFDENIWKTKELLEVGLSGISGKTDELDRILEKFNEVEGMRGRAPKGYQPKIESTRLDEENLVKLEMDERSAWTLRKVMEQAKLKNTALRFHLYAILAVAIWGAFETYLVMIYEELYRKRPEMLKSEEKLTFQNAIEHKDDILDYLIETQIDKIGHFTFTEHLKYLKSRLSFEFTHKTEKELADYYLVRNVVAHNLGLVQGAIRNQIPNVITVKDNQIQITKAYLESMIKNIQKSTSNIEKFILAKY